MGSGANPYSVYIHSFIKMAVGTEEEHTGALLVAFSRGRSFRTGLLGPKESNITGSWALSLYIEFRCVHIPSPTQ